MKKLIMFVMVLAIATPAMALVYPPHSPGFAGCDNSGQVIWEFTEDGCMPTSNVADPPFLFNPDLPDPTFGTRYADGGPIWTWSDGVYTYTVNGEDSLNQPIPDSGGKPYMRMFFEVVHTMVGSTDESLIGMGLEVWSLGDWTGCPDLSGNDGEIGDYGGGYEFPAPTETFDVEGGWFQSYWVFDFSDDGSVGTQSFDLSGATHTTAIIGMSDFGATNFQLKEVYINYIWYNNVDGSDIPTEDCESIVIPGKNRLIVDVNDIPIYEPQDAGGPEAGGPTDGQLQVSLTWQPSVLVGETETYPAFICTVLVDPDPNQEITYNADFTFPDSTEPNGNLTLTFTEANWSQYQNVYVAATADLLREGNESFNIEFTITIDIDDPNFGGPGYDPIMRKRGIIVVDNDIPFISVIPPAVEGQLSEDDPYVSKCFDVRLSHLPDFDVEVLVVRESDFSILLTSMSVMDPNFFTWADPNKLTFTPGNYNIPQQICLEAIDDDELAEPWLEWVPGVVILTPSSEDARFDIEAESEFAIEEAFVDFDVQDNECGAWGYDPLDSNEDCVVDLSEVAGLYGQWLMCTEPYDDGEVCDKLWNLFEE